MNPSLAGIDAKLRRAQTQIHDLYRVVEAGATPEPYTVRIDKDPDAGELARRFVALKTPGVREPAVSVVLFAGEILYQLRSGLDHLVHQLVLLSGHAAKLHASRRHQFPIFETADGYRKRADGMIDGVSPEAAALIEGEQPYRRLPDAPRKDLLWLLQDLHNTDKHRVIPTTVIGIGVVNIYEGFGQIGSVQSPNVVLAHDQVFFSLLLQRPDQDIRAELRCTIAFEQAMSPYGVTLGIPGVLLSIMNRVTHLVNRFRPLFPETQ